MTLFSFWSLLSGASQAIAATEASAPSSNASAAMAAAADLVGMAERLLQPGRPSSCAALALMGTMYLIDGHAFPVRCAAHAGSAHQEDTSTRAWARAGHSFKSR